MTKKTEQDQIRAILVQAIANICRKGLTYRKNFSIEGLLGITLDDDEIFLLNIKETIHHSGYLLSTAKAKHASPNTSTPKHGTRSKRKSLLSASLDVSQNESAAEGGTRGKRCSSGGAADSEPSPKKASTSDLPEDLSIKPEVESAGEDQEYTLPNGTAEELTNGQADQGSDGLSVEPIRQRTLWGRSRRSKPRKSIPVRAVPSESQPVFPEQDATDLGHFLSMKPMLRDIDETESNVSTENKDEESNQSGASLRIDTGHPEDGRGSDDCGKGGSVGRPQVYIDHCVDGELSDVLNLTGDSEMDTSHGSGLSMIPNGTQGYQCGLCESVFDDQTSCRRHMRHQHKAKVSYTCELCGRRFWHRGDYNEHKAVFHEGPGGYPCSHCGKVLLSKRGLKEHTQHHTGQFPYFCVHCNRGFGRKFEYTGHIRKHHPDDVLPTENS